MTEPPQRSDRESAIAAGSLLILGVVTSLVSTGVLGDIVGGDNYLASIRANEARVLVSIVFQFLTTVCSAGIAIAFYPVLRRHSPTLAIGAVSFRVIEAVFYSLAALGLLCLVALSYQSTNIEAGAVAVVGGVLRAARDAANYVFGVFSFSIGATLYYVVLYRARLIPVWLTLWGVLGALLVFIAAMGTLVDGPPYVIEGAATALALPIATQEIALALWLIARGFEDRGSPSTPRPRAA